MAGADPVKAKGLGAGYKGGDNPIVQVSYKVIVGKGTYTGPTNVNTNLNFKGAPGIFLVSEEGHQSTTIDCNRTNGDGKITERAFVVHSGEVATGTCDVVSPRYSQSLTSAYCGYSGVGAAYAWESTAAYALKSESDSWWAAWGNGNGNGGFSVTKCRADQMLMRRYGGQDSADAKLQNYLDPGNGGAIALQVPNLPMCLPHLPTY